MAPGFMAAGGGREGNRIMERKHKGMGMGQGVGKRNWNEGAMERGEREKGVR